jgi:hypothetical protein
MQEAGCAPTIGSCDDLIGEQRDALESEVRAWSPTSAIAPRPKVMLDASMENALSPPSERNSDDDSSP